MSNGPPVCLTIAGLDPSGGAGIVADIRTFEAFGCRSSSAVTSITFQNSKAVQGFVHMTGEEVTAQMQPVFEEFDIAAVKIGMLPTVDVVRNVASVLTSRNARNIVIDPVMTSSSGTALIEPDVIDAVVKELSPLATLVTPNIPEAERLTRTYIRDEDTLRNAARAMQQAGARNVLIKGGHFDAHSHISRDFLFAGDEMTIFDSVRVHNVSVRGTGCILSSAIAANLAIGHQLNAAVKISKDHVFGLIKSAADEVA